MTMNDDFSIQTVHTVHMIGIGGIGMSALARMFLVRGVRVSGSDLSESVITHALAEKGAVIGIGQAAVNIPEHVDIIVYSPAIVPGNLEYDEAIRRGVPMFSYPETLGLVSRGMRTIAVSGTHGKTTTTAMIAHILVKEGKSPTVIAGSLMNAMPAYGIDERTNFIPGESDIFVVEACEYKRSFLNVSPNILVITNIEEDHLDYYKDIDDILDAFRTLVGKTGQMGTVIADMSLPYISRALEGFDGEVVDTRDIVGDISLVVPGAHNVGNARAAVAAARAVGVSEAAARAALVDFSGTWRRSEYKGVLVSGATVYDDYAHHPTEIRATLAGFRERFPGKNITVLFQPHLYSRTREFLEAFAHAFIDADNVIITDIYAARERDDGTVHARDLVLAMGSVHPRATYGGPLNMIVENLMATHALSSDDILITMGAGDVYRIGERLLEQA
ncbi:MAG: UDP-N-acetylmuramate--L-alanine ligase [Candidatus Yonathbacteria bacterium]|nr:UDP-N-acetylmuramate--L-alanine ligase [Candidatus Yonathbacteria bacterium]